VEDDPPAENIATSPTISRMATRAGIIVGTAAYMSPEQAKGNRVDRRTDIWAFGCVLFEILTSKNAFTGETVTDILAAVVMKEPKWDLLPSSTPPRIRELLKRCLKKDVKQRLQSIGDARIAIEEALQEPSESNALQPKPARSSARWLTTLPWVLFAIVVGIFSWFFMSHRSPPPAFPAIAAVLASARNLDNPKISPDGNAVVYDDGVKLWIRKLRELEARPIEGTEGGHDPFWSPNSRWIGYFRENEIRKISIFGGPSSLVCSYASGDVADEAAWGAGDRIVFGMVLTGLFEVSAQGGQPKVFAQADPAKDEDLLRAPRFLSDGKTLLMTVRRPGSGVRLDTIAVQSGEHRQIVLQIPNSILVGPVASEKTGHILFREASPNPGIWAVPFSFSTLKTTGQPFLVRANADSSSISSDGNMVYLSVGELSASLFGKSLCGWTAPAECSAALEA
jgi:hypothetical protein